MVRRKNALRGVSASTRITKVAIYIRVSTIHQVDKDSIPISIYFRELPIVANAETKWFPLPERNTLTGTGHQIIVALCIVEVKNATMPL